MAVSACLSQPHTFTYLSRLLFGGHPFGTSSNTLISLLLYIATQLLWLLPIAGFFTCLDSWRRGFYKRSIALGFVSLIVSITGIALVFA